MGLLLSHFRGIRPHLSLRGECRGVFPVVAGSLGPSRNSMGTSGNLWEPLVLPQGSNAFFQVARGTLGFLLNHCMGIGLHHELGQETQVSTLVVTEISGFLSSFKRGVRPRLMLRHGTPLSSRVVKGVSGLLSSSGRELGLFLEVQQGSQTSLSTVRGYSGFHSSWCRDSGLISS